jgi:putative addiction module killer protein
MWRESGPFGGVATGQQTVVKCLTVDYNCVAMRVQQEVGFRAWLAALRDRRAAKRINQRIIRLQSGNFGDVRYFGGIGELRVDHGPGYRLYFVRKGDVLVVLLCGGDKSSQQADIAKALTLAKEY